MPLWQISSAPWTVSRVTKRDPLVDILVKHGKCISNGRGYVCRCGHDLPNNSRVRLAEHQAEVIEEWLFESQDHYV